MAHRAGPDSFSAGGPLILTMMAKLLNTRSKLDRHRTKIRTCVMSLADFRHNLGGGMMNQPCNYDYMLH